MFSIIGKFGLLVTPAALFYKNAPSYTLSVISEAFFGSITSLASKVSELFDFFDTANKLRIYFHVVRIQSFIFEIRFSSSSNTNNDSLREYYYTRIV